MSERAHDNALASENETATVEHPQPQVAPRDTSHLDRTWKQSHHRSPNEKETAELIELIDGGTAKVTAVLDNGAELDDSQIKELRSALDRHRSRLMTLVTELPHGSPLLAKAFATSDGVTRVVSRLESLARGRVAGVQTANDAAQGDAAEKLFVADRIAPPGFCDTAPQHVAPCQLDQVTRDRYRRYVTNIVSTAAANWNLAITNLHVEEKLKRETDSFEKKLGELLMGALFGVLGSVVTAVAHHGIEKVFHPHGSAEGGHDAHASTQAAHTTTPKEHASPSKDAHDASPSKEGHDAASSQEASPSILAETVKEAGDKLVDKTMDATKEGLSLKKLDEAAVAKVEIPDDRAGFLDAMKGGPDQWKASIMSNLDRLLDVDLAALVGGLPGEENVSVPKFEARISATLKRFDDQVHAITDDVRPIVVIPPKGPVRRALTKKHMAPNPQLHGEWKNSDTWTGKWSFVRWIDDDMAEMAVARSEQVSGNGANTTYRTSSDATFWDESSQTRIASELPKDNQ